MGRLWQGFPIKAGNQEIVVDVSTSSFIPASLAKVDVHIEASDELGTQLEKDGFGFRCDTNDALSMGDHTSVHCTYIDDPDECWIELIEVHKIPIIEKLGIFMDVQKRKPSQPLPKWMLHALRFNRIKD